MEPMTLGSPMGSPVQSPNNTGSQSAYLPGFLLGDNNVHARLSLPNAETTRFGNNSPTINSNPSMSSSYTSSPPDYRTNRQRAMFGSVAAAAAAAAAITSPSVSQVTSDNQMGGPPTKSLFDTLETTPSLINSPISTTANQSIYSNQSSRVLSGNMSLSFLDSTANPANQETSSQCLLQWITVFGFSPSALNAVLAHISSRIRIIDKHHASHPQSNWIHLKCSSEQEAQRALLCNGNIVSGSIMIGVIPCTDEGVILGNDKENRMKLNSSSMRLFSSPIKAAQGITPSDSMKTPVRIQNARPLISAYNQNFSPQSVRSPENIPQKSTGLVSKAMEYMFGW